MLEVSDWTFTLLSGGGASMTGTMHLVGLASSTAPAIQVSGQISDAAGSVSTTLALLWSIGSDEEWPLPELSVSELSGTLSIAPAGDVVLSLSASGINAELADMLQLIDWTVSPTINATLDADGSVVTYGPIVDAAGSIRVGGSGASGFLANVSGTINAAAQSASVSLSHAGGWSPLDPTAELSSLLATPAFDGSLALGPSPRISLSAEVAYLAPIELISRYLKQNLCMHMQART